MVRVMVRVSKLLGSEYGLGKILGYCYGYGWGTLGDLGGCSSTLTTY